MRRIIATSLLLCAALTIVGCATSIEKQMLEQGSYAEVYFDSQIGRLSKSESEKANVVSEVLSKTGGAKETRFKDLLSNYMESKPKSMWFFLDMQTVLRQGVKDGLISSDQQAELGDQLLYLLAKESIQSPGLLKEERITTAFPTAGKYRSKIALSEFAKLQADPNIVGVLPYIPLYQFFVDTNDEAAAGSVRTAMRSKVENQLKGGDSTLPNLSAAEPLFSYIRVTGDRTLDSSVLAALAKVKFARIDLTTGNIPSLFPTYAKEKLANSVVKLNITSQNDEFIVGELIEELKKQNEWLEIADDAARKLTVGRIRFQENRPSPSNMTETVHDLSFGTILYIPKNASVLFDYSKSEYAVQWSMGVMDSLSKASKTVSGQRKAEKVECRNLRYQNVFGGTGALPGYPNDAVARFCQSTQGVDFDRERAEAVKEIANEINRAFLVAK